jgi:hypothetical protein
MLNRILSGAFARKSDQLRAKLPFVKDTAWYLLVFGSWLPAVIFFNAHVYEVGWINGASMYPYFNTDYHRNMKKDAILTRKWAPLKDLRRGMIVTFWFVGARSINLLIF